MKRFLTRIAVYSFIFILSSYIFQFLIDQGLQNVNDDLHGDWNSIFKGKIKADIVILGSSRAYVHFDPKIIEQKTKLSAFNLAVNGGGPITQKSKFESFLEHNPFPRILIQNVDIFLLYKEKFIFQKEQFLPYLSQAAIYSNLEKVDKELWLERNIPLYKYRGFRNEIFLGIGSFLGLAKESHSTKYKGFTVVKEDWNRDFERFRTENTEMVYDQENLDYGFNYVKRLINECKRKKIDIILVQSPLYFELQNMMPQKEYITRSFKDIAVANGIQFWDYLTDSMCLDKKYFYNSTHLNAEGAQLFTNKFSDDLREYLEQSSVNYSLQHNKSISNNISQNNFN